MTSAEIKVKLEYVNDQLKPLLKIKSELEQKFKDTYSREWITANGVRRKDVANPDDDDNWYGHIRTFIRHLEETGSIKRWVCWNGRIYSYAELLNDYMDPDAPGLFEHVPD